MPMNHKDDVAGKLWCHDFFTKGKEGNSHREIDTLMECFYPLIRKGISNSLPFQPSFQMPSYHKPDECVWPYICALYWILYCYSQPFWQKKNVIIFHFKFKIYNSFGSFCFTGLYHWYLTNLTFFIGTWDVLSELVVSYL